MRAPKKLEVHVFHHREKPAIGAVVAMVAAARMAHGGWQPSAGQRDESTHWDWMPTHVGCVERPACGGGRWLDYALPAGEIAEVTCPDCRRMHAMVYGGAE